MDVQNMCRCMSVCMLLCTMYLRFYVSNLAALRTRLGRECRVWGLGSFISDERSAEICVFVKSDHVEAVERLIRLRSGSGAGGSVSSWSNLW